MAATRRSTALSTVITVMAMLAMTGCQDETPTDPTVTGIALKRGGGGGKGPKVESTDPTQAPQDTTLDVQVFGSSFDDGSSVTFTIDGTPSGLVETNSTTFVSDKELIANVTIDLSAIVDLYDVEVLSFRGRKGIGADLFSVKKKGDTALLYSVEVTELGTVDGATRVIPQAIASALDGTYHIVGNSNAQPDALWHVTLDASGSPGTLTLLNCGSTSCSGSSNGAQSIDVNGDGLIVSARRTEPFGSRKTGLNQATYWTSATVSFTDLPNPVGSIVSGANGISATGYVAGHAIVGKILDDGDVIIDHVDAMLWTINDAGESVIAHNLHLETFQVRGATRSSANDVNDDGQVVGTADIGAFLWNNGSFIELPGEGDVWPDAINNSSPVQVAGFLQNLPDGAPGGGVVWTVEDGALLSTEVLPPLTGSQGSWLALDINDAGDVAGRGDKNNAGHALLWTRDKTTGAYVVVDLGLGSAEGIENVSLLEEGVIRVVGYVEGPQGKGKSRPTVLTAVMWTVRKLN